MEYEFFYFFMFLTIISFLICIKIKSLSFGILITGIATVGYSLVYEIILGDRMQLYHYISPQMSTLYMVLGAIFIYPLLNMIYLLFLPKKISGIMLYTIVWIILMISIELLSLNTGTVVFTGWKLVPWSIVTYVATYGWILFLSKKMKSKQCF